MHWAYLLAECCDPYPKPHSSAADCPSVLLGNVVNATDTEQIRVIRGKAQFRSYPEEI